MADGIKQSLAKKDFVIPFHVAANFADEHRGQLKDALGKIWFRKSPSEIAADHDGYPNRELVEAALLKNNRNESPNKKANKAGIAWQMEELPGYNHTTP